MSSDITGMPEIESFNLTDLDVAALDSRLELTSMIPACTLISCNGNCPCNRHCSNNCHIDCTCNSRGGGCVIVEYK